MKKGKTDLLDRVKNYILQHESRLKMKIHNISQLIDYILKKKIES